MSRFAKLETAQATPSSPPEEAPLAESLGEEIATFDDAMQAGDRAFYLGRWNDALRHYSRALQFDNSQSAPWVGQILALILKRQIREATVWAQRATECFPDAPVMISLHGLTFALQGSVQRGLATSDYAMGQGRANLVCWIARGWILLEAGSGNWAFCFEKAAEECPPGEWRTHMLMGLVLEQYRKWPRAAERYQKAVSQQTGNYFLWNRLGICYAKLGLARKAFEAQQHAMELNSQCRDAEREIRRLSRLPLGIVFAWLRHIFTRKPAA